MRANVVISVLSFALVTGPGRLGLTQVMFTNLDFESATIIPIEGHSYYPHAVATSNALPGWTAHVYEGWDYWVLYDNLFLDLAAVSIHDTNSQAISGIKVLQGKYSVLLQQSFDGTVTPSITQTGTIPATAKSLLFYNNYPFRLFSVDFDGQYLSVVLLGGSGNPEYLWGADVSLLAGHTGRLRFSGFSNWMGTELDAIHFSSLPIPVPLHVSTTATNTLLLSWFASTNAFFVQVSSNPAATNWVTLTNLSVGEGYPCQGTLPLPTEPTFYRLISQ